MDRLLTPLLFFVFSGAVTLLALGVGAWYYAAIYGAVTLAGGAVMLLALLTLSSNEDAVTSRERRS